MAAIYEHFRQAARVLAGKAVVVGLSGGMDSVALLSLLTEMNRRGAGIQLTAAHVHHGIRGAEADRDAAFCAELCADWGVAFELVARDVPALAKAHGIGLEEAGRLARYEAFEALRRKRRADYVAVGHHADDQAETVLLNLLRGAGLAGVCGMRAMSGVVVRPMLKIAKADIAAYCAGNGLRFVTDSTNAGDAYTRNVIRNQILPAAARVNPAASRALARFAETAADDDAYLNQLAKQAYAAARSVNGLNRDALAALDIALRRRVVRLAIQSALGGLKDIPAERVEAVLALPSGKTADVHGGLKAVRRRGEILFLNGQSYEPVFIS